MKRVTKNLWRGTTLIAAFAAGFWARDVSPWHGLSYGSWFDTGHYDHSLSGEDIAQVNEAVNAKLEAWEHIESWVIPLGAGSFQIHICNARGRSGVPELAVETATKAAQEALYEVERSHSDKAGN